MPRIADVAPDAVVPPELETLVQRMLTKDRADRIQTMEEIEVFLHDFQAAYSLKSSADPLDPRGSGPLPAVPGSDSGPVDSAALSERRTLLAGSTPRSLRSPHDLQDTALTAQLLVVNDAPGQAKPSSRLMIALLAGVAAFGLVVVFFVLGKSHDPAPPVTPPVTVAAAPSLAPPTPTPVVVPPVPDPPVPDPPEPGTTGVVEPVPSDIPAVDPKPRKSPIPKPAVKPVKPADPLKQVRKSAGACRKQHNAVKGPPITIEYAIGSDGEVTRAVPAVKDALGVCLADAVRVAKFAPQLKLGLKIAL